jgi:hypothetical protein
MFLYEKERGCGCPIQSALMLLGQERISAVPGFMINSGKARESL